MKVPHDGVECTSSCSWEGTWSSYILSRLKRHICYEKHDALRTSLDGGMKGEVVSWGGTLEWSRLRPRGDCKEAAEKSCIGRRLDAAVNFLRRRCLCVGG
jgi:hypothetical protein